MKNKKKNKLCRYDQPNSDVRRKNLAMARRCPYCGSKVIFVTGEQLTKMVNEHPNRGRNKPPFVANHDHYYVCGNFVNCQSYIGAYENTYDPMGEMANKKLRMLRIHAHLVFDEMWKNKIFSKDEAYAFLSDKLSLKKNQTHISQFNIYNCEKTIEIASAVLKKHGIRVPELRDFFDKPQVQKKEAL